LEQSGQAGGGKPPELELWSNRWIVHPLSRRLAILLIPTPLTPNMVSCLGVVAAAGAAYFYGAQNWDGPAWPWSVACGFLCHVGWHVIDGADGELARRTGRSSPTGEVVDGVCDYAGQAVLYLALALLLSRTLGGWAWPLALLSGLSRAVQANSYESRRRTYQYWAYGAGWLRQSMDGAKGQDAPSGLLAALGRAYLAISERVARANGQLERALAAQLAESPAAAERARDLYRQGQAPALRAAQPLSANARTIALGLSMAGGSPLYFFLYEIVGLAFVLVWSLRVQVRADAAVTAALGQASALSRTVKAAAAKARGAPQAASAGGRTPT
jgi:hypothetical protein